MKFSLTKKFSPVGRSSTPYWSPRNVVLASITGGIRITWDADARYETEIWLGINGGTKTLITTIAPNIGTYDYICEGGVALAFDLRFKDDNTILSVPTGFTAVDQTGGIVRLTCDAVTGADHYVWSANIAGAGHSVIATTVNPTYDHNVGGNTQVLYKVRAKEGTLPVYSNYTSEIDITTVAVNITDADGNIYTEVVIGSQTWLKENLKTTKYRDGSSIENPSNANWNANTAGGYKWYSDDAATYKEPYGALYNYPAATNAKGIAPVGYHIPTLAEWNTLMAELGGTTVAGGHLKEDGTTHWTSDNADNSSGFTAVGSGFINETTGASSSIKGFAMVWCSDGTMKYIQHSDTVLSEAVPNTKRGITIRCIKD
jgi:uncharacterized protein (TIGR02145 family)